MMTASFPSKFFSSGMSQDELNQVVSETVVEDDSLRDTDVRYLAYAQRVTRALTASSRYLAFSSDVGEAFRPVVPPRLVSFSYALTWGYVFSDIGFSAYNARKLHPENVAFLKDRVGRAASFQLVGSVALPFLIIHSGVKYSAKLFDRLAPSQRLVRAWGPSAVGLAIIPLLPALVDHPVEQAVDFAFKKWNPFGLDSNLVEMHHHKGE
jgi:fission process protein 1